MFNKSFLFADRLGFLIKEIVCKTYCSIFNFAVNISFNLEYFSRVFSHNSLNLISYFNNLAIPFSGLALFVGKEGWKGACGVISGSVSAIAIIMGGQEKTRDLEVPNIYGKAIRFATKFEERFGALTCEELCGVNLKENLREYVKNRLWEKKCCNFVSFAIDQVRKITRKELKNKWEK